MSVVGGTSSFFEVGKTYARTRVDGSPSEIEFRAVLVEPDPNPGREGKLVAFGFGRESGVTSWRAWVRLQSHWDRTMRDGKPGWVEVVPKPNAAAMLVLGRHRPSDDSSWASCTFCHQYTPPNGFGETFPVWPCDAVRLAVDVTGEPLPTPRVRNESAMERARRLRQGGVIRVKMSELNELIMDGRMPGQAN